jgi:hypothetical protein
MLKGNELSFPVGFAYVVRVSGYGLVRRLSKQRRHEPALPRGRE